MQKFSPIHQNKDGQEYKHTRIPCHVFDKVMEDHRLTQTSKLIYLQLLQFASKRSTNEITWSNSWLAKRFGLCKKTIQRSIAELKNAGYIDEHGFLVIPEGEEEDLISKPASNNARANITNTSHRTNTVNSINTINTTNKVITTNTTNTSNNINTANATNNANVTNIGITISTINSTNTAITVNNANTQNTINTINNANIINRVNTTQPQRPSGESGAIIASSLLDLLKGKINTEQVNQVLQEHLPPHPAEQDNSVPQDGTFLANQLDKNVPEDRTNLSPKTIQETNKKKEQSKQYGNVHASLSDVGCSAPSDQSATSRMIAELATVKSARKGFDPIRYAAGALARMKASKQDMERYLSELAYSFTRGCYANAENPLRAVRGALRKIEDGCWKAPAGMYC